jgi:O-antigen/teichoic acid export membrane protein
VQVDALSDAIRRASQNLLSWAGLEQGNLYGKFGKGVLWNIASYGVMALVGVLANVIIIRWYDPSALGVFNQVYAVYMLVSQFAIAGIHLSVIKYVAQYSSQPEMYRPANFVALILSIGFASVSTLGLWFLRGTVGDWLGSPQVAIGLAYAAPGILFFSINKFLLGILNGLSRMQAYAIFQGVRSVAIITVLLGIALGGGPAVSLPLAFSIAEVVILLALLPATVSEFAWPRRTELYRWMGLHFNFGMKSFLSNVLLQMNTRIDVLILGVFWSDHIVGIYSFAAALTEGIYQLLVVLRTNYNPSLVRLVSEGQMEALKARIRKGRRITYIFTSVICLALLALYPLGILIGQNDAEYLQSWPALAILLAGVLVSSGYIPFGALLLQAGRPGIHTLMSLIWVIINISLNLLLAPAFGILGAAVATALTYMSFVFLLRRFIKNVLKIAI